MRNEVLCVSGAARRGLLILSLQLALSGQPPSKPPNAADPVFRTDSALALVRFQAVSQEGYLPDLDVAEIELQEDGVPRKIALFEGGNSERSSQTEVHLLFDCSNSVQTAGPFNPKAFDAYILDRFQNARIAIWGFNSKLRNFTDPTRNSASLNRAMDAVRHMKQGNTPVYGSIVRVIDRLAKAKTEAVRMIVPVSDGLPFGDGGTPASTVNAAKRAGIALYPALIYSLRSRGTGRASEWQEQLEFLGTAAQTGGRAFEFGGTSADDLMEQILKGIATEIRTEYVAGYYPASTGTPRVHKVQVVLKDATRGRIVGGARDIRR
jgi:VWFA-related protein